MNSQDKFAKDQDPRLRRWLRAKGLSQADADDAAQDSWLAYLTGSSRFAGRSTEATYLFGIGKNKARERKRAPEQQQLDANFAGGATPEAAAQDAEGVRRIQACIDELPATQKKVIHERAFEDRDVGVIAKKLKTTANNVSVLLHRARTFLASCIHADS